MNRTQFSFSDTFSVIHNEDLTFSWEEIEGPANEQKIDKKQQRERERQREKENMARDIWNFEAIENFFQSQQYFDSDGGGNGRPRFPQITALSRGAEGFSFLVREVDAAGRPLRRLAVKYAKLPEWDDKLRAEIAWVDKLRHARHVVDPVDVDTEAFGRPLLVMEFLDHGTLKEFITRVRAARTRIPNLILWRLLLCCKKTLGPKEKPNLPFFLPRYGPLFRVGTTGWSSRQVEELLLLFFG